MDPLIVLFGFGVGILVGTTGMGGGSLMTPLLILVFGIKPVIAIGTDLAYAAVTKTVGGWKHFRQGTVDMGISLWLGAGSVPGALGGVYVLSLLHRAYGASFDTIVLYLIAGALLVTGVLVLARALFWSHHLARERETVELQRRHKVFAIVFGAVIGFVLGVTSAGSGTLIAVGLIIYFRLTPRRVVGTDVFHAAILLWVASAGHLISGNVDLGLTANILVGSVPGVWLGAHVSQRLPDAGLRPALGIVLLAASMGLATKAGVAIPPLAIVGVPSLLAVAAWLVHRGRGDMEAEAMRELRAAEPIPGELAVAGRES